MSFGRRLKELREEKNLSQIELSKNLNISNSALSLYESDRRTPDFETLKRIALFFDVSTDYLLGLTDIRKYDLKNGSRILYLPNLPEEAVKLLEEHAEFLKNKYGSDKNKTSSKKS